MAYYLNLFSPETYETFSNSGRDISGFRKRQENAARKIKVGDRLICYLTKVSRFVGILEVQSLFFEDDTPIYYPEKDPFIIRFKVNPLIWLPKEKAFPIKDERLWERLSFTHNYDKNSSFWTGKFRNSLNPLSDSDGKYIENLLRIQVHGDEIFSINEEEYERYKAHEVKTLKKVVKVSVPVDEIYPKEQSGEVEKHEVRESIKIQALLAFIGSQMGMKIWIPRGDKTAVLEAWKDPNKPVLDILPLNYDEATLRTIEQIDILWLRGRSIIRAFEVEHTTSIYSGILRMADLLALQPNMDIKLHIVAPAARRDKVFQELRRPVFSLLEKGPLSESCTYLSYESVMELSKEKHLSHFSDTVLDDYSESSN
jgi:predicted RNA-binding protein